MAGHAAFWKLFPRSHLRAPSHPPLPAVRAVLDRRQAVDVLLTGTPRLGDGLYFVATRAPGVGAFSGSFYGPTSQLHPGQAFADDPSYLDLVATGQPSASVRVLRFGALFLDGEDGFVTASSHLPVGTAFSVVVTAKQALGDSGYFFAKSDGAGNTRPYSLFYSAAREEYVTGLPVLRVLPCNPCRPPMRLIFCCQILLAHC